jgi:hypothetical protein
VFRSRQGAKWAVWGLLILVAAGCNPDQADKEASDEPDVPNPSGISVVRGPTLSRDSLLSEQARTLPPSGAAMPAGLERQEWTVADYGNPAQVLSIGVNAGSAADQGTPSRLALELFGGPAYSTALCLEGTWRLSVTGEAETALVIYNASAAAMQGSLAYTLSDAYLWYESRPFILKPGWNTVRIRQGAGDFKTESSNWQHTAGLWRPEDCRRITLLFHNGRRTGRLFLEHISVAENPADAQPRPARRSVFQSPKQGL